MHIDTSNCNGAVNNGVQGSADGATMPNPRTTGTGTHAEESTDINPD